MFLFKNRDVLYRLLYLLPLLLPVSLIVISIVSLFFLVLNLFVTWIVWAFTIPLLLAAAFVLYKVYPAPSISRNQALISGAVVLLSLLWGVGNTFFASQHVFVDRDPGIYGQAAVWLLENNSLRIPTSGIFDVGYPAASEFSAGFGGSLRVEGEAYAQGTHTVPSLLALFARTVSFSTEGGISLVYKLSPLLACFAFMTLFAFARLFIQGRWALLASLSLALSLPALYFSRDIYTEMLALTFIFTGATLVLSAIRTVGKLPRMGMWAIAGVCLGAANMIRIDAIVALIGIFGAVILYLAYSNGNKLRHVFEAIIFFCSFILIALIGYADLYYLSSGYVQSLLTELKLELLLLLAASIGGAIFVTLSWRTNVLSLLDRLTKSWRVQVSIGAALLGCLFLVTRQLWMVDHNHNRHPIVQKLIAQMQISEGLPVDGLRTYAEATTNWILWYMGPVLTLMAVLGLLLVIRKALTTKDVKWALLFSLVFITSFLYLNEPAITPDQIWASRRLLPVVLPCVAILGVLAIRWIYMRQKLPYGLDPRITATVLATLGVIGPLFVAYPFVPKREYVPHLAVVNQFCQALPANAAVIWVGGGRDVAVRTTVNICKSPAAGVSPKKLTNAALKDVAGTVRQKGYVPVLATLNNEFYPSFGISAQTTHQVASSEYNKYGISLTKPPRYVDRQNISIHIGYIENDGSVSPPK